MLATVFITALRRLLGEGSPLTAYPNPRLRAAAGSLLEKLGALRSH